MLDTKPFGIRRRQLELLLRCQEPKRGIALRDLAAPEVAVGAKAQPVAVGGRRCPLPLHTARSGRCGLRGRWGRAAFSVGGGGPRALSPGRSSLAFLPPDSQAADLLVRESGQERSLRCQRLEDLGSGVEPGFMPECSG